MAAKRRVYSRTILNCPRGNCKYWSSSLFCKLKPSSLSWLVGSQQGNYKPNKKTTITLTFRMAKWINSISLWYFKSLITWIFKLNVKLFFFFLLISNSMKSSSCVWSFCPHSGTIALNCISVEFLPAAKNIVEFASKWQQKLIGFRCTSNEY